MQMPLQIFVTAANGLIPDAAKESKYMNQQGWWDMPTSEQLLIKFGKLAEARETWYIVDFRFQLQFWNRLASQGLDCFHPSTYLNIYLAF